MVLSDVRKAVQGRERVQVPHHVGGAPAAAPSLWGESGELPLHLQQGTFTEISYQTTDWRLVGYYRGGLGLS